MRELDVSEITKTVADLCQSANTDLPEDVHTALKNAKNLEESEVGQDILDQLLENAKIAIECKEPICQDTGFAVIFIKLGQDVHLVGGDLTEAINAGVRKGYTEGYLRKSIVGNPLERVNTKDNTPAVIHLEIVPGDQVKIIVAPKGGGSENVSAIRMLKPAEGIDGIKQFVVETVKAAGANPCPPITVGVGIGGTFEKCALLAKTALLRETGIHHKDSKVADLETELLTLVNKTGIGPGGLGGRVTALAVHVEIYPCHIASLPVAVNINCHAARHKEAIL